jgi:hypothetical protein
VSKHNESTGNTHTHAQDQLALVGPNTCNSDQTNHGVPGNAAHAPQGKWKTCTAVLAAAEQSRQGPPRASAPCCTCTAPIHWFRCAPMLLLAASAAWVLAAAWSSRLYALRWAAGPTACQRGNDGVEPGRREEREPRSPLASSSVRSGTRLN